MNWSACLPASTSSAASMIASASRASSRPVSLCVSAAAFLIHTCATTNGRSGGSSLMGKFSRARMVCTPYSASAATCFGPSGSFSVRKASAIVVSLAKGERGGGGRVPRGDQKCDGSGDAGDAEQRDARAVQPAEGDAPCVVACQRIDRATRRGADRFDARRDDGLGDDAGGGDHESRNERGRALHTACAHCRDEPDRSATPEEWWQHTPHQRAGKRSSRQNGKRRRSDDGTNDDRCAKPCSKQHDDGDAATTSRAGVHRVRGRTAPVRKGFVRRSRSSVVRGPCPGCTTVSPGRSDT